MSSPRLDPRTNRRLRRSGDLSRTLLCAVGGTAVAFSLPPWGFWPLAIVGIALFHVGLGDEPSPKRRAILGFSFALPWMLIGMAWMWFLTAPGYVVAAAIFAGFHAAAAAAVPNGRYRTIVQPAAHTLIEFVRISVPFGGVPLATLGISQAGGPLLGLARVGGVLLITWTVWQIGTAAVSWLGMLSGWYRTRSIDWVGRRTEIFTLGAVIAVFILAAVAPTGTPTGETIDVAAVQGGGRQGTSALEVPSSEVTRVHLEATRSIVPDDELDLVVWPENGIDIDRMPFVESDEFDLVAAEAARLDVPIAVGVTDDSEFSLIPRPDAFVNAQVLVTPDGQVVDRYEKVHLVPFGEYVPFRGLIEALGVDLSRVAGDAVSGLGPAQLALDDGTTFGVMISWEVFFGDRGRAAADDDAAFLINPTNGASYTWTIVQTQQVASSRLRAVETGRWVVQVAPTGFSAFVSPDGEVFQRTDVSEQQVIRQSISLREGSTWYTRLGDSPFVLLFGIVVAIGWIRTVRRRDELADEVEAVTDRSATPRASV